MNINIIKISDTNTRLKQNHANITLPCKCKLERKISH